jgi:pimeloyl-ACP methyl ester carboxylesterase
MNHCDLRSDRERGISRRFRRHSEVSDVAAGLLASIVFAVTAAQADDLPKTQAQALAYETADRMPPTSLYDTAAPLPPGRPGELIRSQAVTDYALPTGVRAVRILYHSQNAAGKDIAASGVVLLPPGTPPNGGWPVIAWAHGTTGVARDCAPSLMKDIYYGTEGLFPMVRAGFAVIATDYAGLGTAGPHQYMSTIAQANDVINSVTAAHSAVADLSLRWVVDGHSQGGGAAWGVAEQEATLKDPDFLGAVAVAGTVNMPWLMDYMAAQSPDSFYAVFLAYGIKAQFPQFRVADMLTEPALAEFHALTTKGCWYYGNATQLNHLLGTSAFKPGWMRNPWVKRFAARDTILRPRLTRPALVLAGGADQSVPAASIRQFAGNACRLGDKLEFRVYPGLDHDPLMEKSTPDQLQWIRARFGDQPAPENCATLVEH